jgi:hypothetical protein
VVAYLSNPTADNVLAARLCVESAVRRADKSDYVSDDPALRRLEALLLTIKQAAARPAAPAPAAPAPVPAAAAAPAADGAAPAASRTPQPYSGSSMDAFR